MDHTNGRKRFWTWTGERDSSLNSVQSCLFVYTATLSPQYLCEVVFGLVTSNRPCFSSRELRRRAAFSVTRINFSLPILIPVRSGLAVRAGAAVSWGVVSLTNL